MGWNHIDTTKMMHVGAIAKIAIRSVIMVIRFSMHLNVLNISPHDDRTYHFKFIERNELDDLHLKAKCRVFIITSDDFCDIIQVAPYLCCEQCIYVKYGSCSLLGFGS